MRIYFTTFIYHPGSGALNRKEYLIFKVRKVSFYSFFSVVAVFLELFTVTTPQTIRQIVSVLNKKNKEYKKYIKRDCRKSFLLALKLVFSIKYIIGCGE